jgi:hypothetical protein
MFMGARAASGSANEEGISCEQVFAAVIVSDSVVSRSCARLLTGPEMTFALHRNSLSGNVLSKPGKRLMAEQPREIVGPFAGIACKCF